MFFYNELAEISGVSLIWGIYPRKNFSTNTAVIGGLLICSSKRLLRTAKVRPFIRFFHTARNRDISKPRLVTVFEKKINSSYDGILFLTSIRWSSILHVHDLSIILPRWLNGAVNSFNTVIYLLFIFFWLDSNVLPCDCSLLIPLNHMIMFILILNMLVYLISE